ncbi:hypothetical protein SESBI_25457 [Sesbania bispinosa]|nr:hypothetical protein SESBI_25457 [Sesbania bispinosa]
MDSFVALMDESYYSCLENDQVADWGNEVTKMIVDQRFFKKNYQGKDGAGYKPDQFLDALQSSQVTEPSQARQKRMNRLNKSQNSNARKNVKNFKSSDRYHSSCEPQSSERIVVLKPGTSSCDCPRPHSSSSFSHNAQNIKLSHFPFGPYKEKVRHVMSVRSKDQQQRRTTAGVPYEFPCGGSCFIGESCSNNTNNTSVSPSEQNTLNIHDGDNKSPSQMFNCGIEEYKQCTNSLVRTIPLPDTGRMIDYNKDQMVLRTKLGLQKDEENYSFSSSGQKIKDPSVATVNTPGDELQDFGADISTRKSFPCDNLHAHYDTPRDCGNKDSPTQNFNIDDFTQPGIPELLFLTSSNVQACVVKNVLAKEIAELVNLHFLPRLSPITLQQLVEKDLAKRGSWLNIQVDTEDIAIEVEKDILEKLVLEIASEMDDKAL